VDALDIWLNTQRSWRHFAVAWLTALPAGVALGAVWAGYSDLTGPTALGASAVLARMAIGAVASVPLAALLFSVESLSRRRPAKPGKNRTPRYLWRGIAGVYLLIADNSYSVWADGQPLQWRQQHDFLIVQVGLDVIAVALVIWNLQYWSRLKRRTAVVATNDPGWL
jgi:hypothetical protein